MNLLQELHDLIARYLDREIPLEELEDALGDLALPISEASDAEATALTGLVWSLLSEYGYSHREERSLRSALTQAIPVRHLEREPVARTIAALSTVSVTIDPDVARFESSVMLGAIA